MQQMSSQPVSQQWNAHLYDRQHAFVWQSGESLIDWLAPQPNEQILDLGCGTGHLSARIAATGAIVLGIDADPAMIATAQQTYPDLHFTVADARNFQSSPCFDAVFSNAALHWMQPPDTVITQIARALKPGGRFVAELGGQGNIEAIVTALSSALQELGYADCESWFPWYFPSIGDYATRLEQQGLVVQQAVLFDRPTPLADGEAGLSNWLNMFANGILSRVAIEVRPTLIQMVEQRLKPLLYNDNQWIADYRRLRIRAQSFKVSNRLA